MKRYSCILTSICNYAVILFVLCLYLKTSKSFAYDGKTVIVAATLSDIKKAEQGKGDMDSKKLVRVPSKVSKRDRSPCMYSLSLGLR